MESAVSSCIPFRYPGMHYNVASCWIFLTVITFMNDQPYIVWNSDCKYMKKGIKKGKELCFNSGSFFCLCVFPPVWILVCLCPNFTLCVCLSSCGYMLSTKIHIPLAKWGHFWEARSSQIQRPIGGFHLHFKVGIRNGLSNTRRTVVKKRCSQQN